MANPEMDFFAYVSRAKVNQLHDQLRPRTISEWKEKSSISGEGKISAGAGGLFGFIKAGFAAKGSRGDEVETTSTQSTIQKLRDVLAHIEDHKKVLDLNELCEKSANRKLDAFAYSYSGEFRVETEFSPQSDSRKLKNLSRKYLVEPGLEENSLKEKNSSGSRIVSNVAILTSSCNSKTIKLACSLKYFQNMGGALDLESDEYHIVPHSGNYHFFEDGEGEVFKALIFITGISENTIMGTPLFLAHASDPELRL